ncbi:3-carboxy-cis,cis-mucoante lactonizing enzyme [Massarina eburnea CBS 473.64]|uniref:3-carboxy-cis,cis-mucoante lactonizing enzyme n=1 Tax=Massarina eburnea CBS 473.64 TaxID=1395130 RepID=A0A6A6SGC7_9PLEO|nr:3-carboxy-cis,cis-mucoante lactonizing enzyme [Massarina eburnea CBS 473.64]
MVSSKAAVVAALAAPALADSHYFFTGFFSGSTIVGVEFDDAASTLTWKQNISTNATGSKWIELDERKQNLYVGSTGAFQSYAVGGNGSSLTYKSEVTLSSGAGSSTSAAELDCTNANFIGVASASPYTVFGIPYGTGCSGLAISVDSSGSIQNTVANLTYNSTSGVHGVDVSPDNDFVYSADDMGNAVWTHSFDSTTGEAKTLQYLAAPEGSDPRHLAVHPNGQWVYVVYEAASSIAVYKRDNETGLLTDMNTTYSLLPTGYTNSSSYWADEVMFSLPTDDITAPKYLVAATRSRQTSVTGQVSVFSLDAETGAISEQLFLLPTTASGGSANAVAPAPFSEDYFAITDSGSNFVEMWKIADDGKSAAAVAHLDLQAGPANVVWYT